MAAAAVWSAWALMLAATLAFVARFGSNVPSWDDWDMVPTLTGAQPVSAGWLWSQHNEHRVPLPRLVLLALNAAFGLDFRVAMYFNVILLGFLALCMIVAASRLRGRISLADAFFPLVLLNWGQAANLLWGWQLQFFASTALGSIALLFIAQTGAPLAWKITSLGTGACLLLLPLSGANGVALVPALACWLIYLGLGYRIAPGGGSRRAYFPSLTLAAAALLLTALYFVGYQRVPYHPTTPSIWATLKTSVQFLTIGLGPAVRAVWPLSGIIAVGLLLLSAALLIQVWYRREEQRPRAAGLLFFLGAMVSLALGLGLGRDGFETRYVSLAVPAWCALYFVASIYAPGRVNTASRYGLLLLAMLALWPNSRFGRAYGTDLRIALHSFEQDLAAGVPRYELVRRYASYLHPHQDVPMDYLPMLQRAGVGPYRGLRPDPPFREIAFPLVPTATHQVRWDDSTAYATGNDPYLVFTLPRDTYAAGIRLRYSHRNEAGTLPYVSIYWKTSRDEEFSTEQFWKYSPTGDRANWERGAWTRLADPYTTVTVWMADTVQAIRIHPDFRPGVFTIRELVLLVPARE